MGILENQTSYSHTISGDTIGKVITCKAAVAYGAGQPLVVEEILVDPPRSKEVRIRILFTSICHTDVSAWQGENEDQRVYPRIFGHEASGVVESVGEGVEDLEVGDHVVPIFNGECGECAYCKSEKTNLCETYRVNPLKSTMSGDGECRFRTKDGDPIYHFLNTSTFTEYTVLDSACCVKIDSRAPLSRMTLLSCGVSTGLGAAWNTANVQPGATVAVFGLGAVGLAVVEGARARGASRIIGVDINSDKQLKELYVMASPGILLVSSHVFVVVFFVTGRAIGITDFVNPKDLDKPVHQKIREMTEGGVQYSFECAGNLDVLREAFLSTHDGWGLAVILGIHPTPRLLPIHPMELFDGRRMVGSVFGDFKGKSQLPHFANQCMKGNVKLDEFITHELPFIKINEALQLLIDGKSLRCLLHH